MGRYKLTQPQIDSLCESYICGKSARTIGEELGVRNQTVFYHLEKRGIKGRSLEEAVKRTYPVDKTFFDVIDTEVKAYWLGFLYADGCVRDGRSMYLSITLAKRDETHLRLLTKHLQTTAPIHSGHREDHVINGVSVGPTDWVAVHVHSRHLCEGLISNGCGPRKSLTVRFPTLEQVPEHLLHHFIRGYFDGDGSISSGIVGTLRQYRVKLLGTQDFLEGCIAYLKRQGIPEASIGLDVKEGRIHRVAYGGNRNIQTVYDILYRDATVWLGRKRERFEACKAQRTGPSNGRPKAYAFRSPLGEVHQIVNLSKWCRENRLGNHRLFYAVAWGERPSHKGWTRVMS